MNKEHWNDLYLDQLDDDFIEKCIRDSYSLVVSKLSKKLREKYNGNNL
jgi:predicted DNA-binding protein (MmcQ/YjbR family)